MLEFRYQAREYHLKQDHLFADATKESRILAAVVLPLPDGPTKATRDPTEISILIPSRAGLFDPGYV